MPGDLASLADESGGRVLVVAAASSTPSGWGRETAVALARAWARRVDRFFLVDLSLEDPGLHDPLEMENQEGITDVVLYGSAIQRVAQPADGGAFFFASAGTPTSDVEAVLSHERWDGLLEGFRRASASLCAYLPADLPGAESILQRADHVVVLREGAGGLGLEAGRNRVAAVLSPPGAEVAPVGEAGTEGEVVDIDDLAPEAEAVVEERAAADAETADEEVVDVEDLAPDPSEPGTDVVDIGELAPEGAEVHREMASEEVAAEEIGPTEEALEESVSFDREIETGADLEVEEEPEDEDETREMAETAAVDIGDLAPEPSGPGTDVVDIGELAPEVAGAGEDALDDSVSFDRQMEMEGDLVVEEDGSGGGEASGEEALHADSETAEEDEGFQDFGGFDGLAGMGEESVADDEDRGVDGPGPVSDAGGPQETSAAHEGGLAEDPTPEVGGTDEDDADDDSGSLYGEDLDAEEDFGAFDMASFDTLGEEDEDAEALTSSEDEVRVRSDFGESHDEAEGGEPDVADAEFGEDVSEMAAVGDEAGPTEEDSEEGGDSFDFGDFSGEMDTVEDEVGEGFDDDFSGEDADFSGDEDIAFGEDDARFDGGDAVDEDFAGEGGGFGEDLVTGPDFGQDAPDDDWTEEDEDTQHAGEAELPDDVPDELDSGRTGPDADEGGTVEEEKEGREAGPRKGGGLGRWLGRAVRVLVLFLVAGGAAAGAHWFDLVQIPGFDRVLVETLGPMAVATTPEVDLGDPVPETPVLDYSLTVDAYRRLEAATEVARAWQESFEGFVFAVVPVYVEGDAFYRLLAGPATTSEEAEALRSSLSEFLTREDPSAWVVRSTPLAFLLSEHESAGAARGEARRLRGEGVPVYVLQVVYPGDTVRYRVYSGAFESGEEARFLQGMLIEHGYDGARFIERRGALPE